MGYEQYIADSGAVSDLEAKKKFLRDLLLAYKAKNQGDSINIFQYLHMMQKIRSWVVTIPSGYGPYTGSVYTIDLCDCFPTADIEGMAKALDWGRANIDDMTGADHWLSTERHAWLLGEIKAWLGWP